MFLRDHLKWKRLNARGASCLPGMTDIFADGKPGVHACNCSHLSPWIMPFPTLMPNFLRNAPIRSPSLVRGQLLAHGFHFCEFGPRVATKIRSAQV